MRWIFNIILYFSFFSLSFAESLEPINFNYLIHSMPKFHSELLQMHLTLYKGYVAGVNQLNERLERGVENSFEFQAVKLRYAFEYDGMVLHELYFQNLGGNGQLSGSSPVARLIEAEYGSFAKWKKEFIETALIKGVGWVILYQSKSDGGLYTAWISDHSIGPLVSDTPLLVLDVWEHAYITQFGLDRKGYVDLFFEYIDWDVVNQRLAR
ncbi:MAG: hypothetical protein S4CHLAM102_03310 [Chlamydiia bacterium]|nr:hypothetical protein [Chlamydiia bacterium]